MILYMPDDRGPITIIGRGYLADFAFKPFRESYESYFNTQTKNTHVGKLDGNDPNDIILIPYHFCQGCHRGLLSPWVLQDIKDDSYNEMYKDRPIKCFICESEIDYEKYDKHANEVYEKTGMRMLSAKIDKLIK